MTGASQRALAEFYARIDPTNTPYFEKPGEAKTGNEKELQRRVAPAVYVNGRELYLGGSVQASLVPAFGFTF